MLKKVTIPSIPLPTLYIAKTKKEVELAIENGIPYVKWNGSEDDLVKCLLRPALEKLFPGIKWDKVLGKSRKFKTTIVNVPGTSEDEKKLRRALSDITIEDNITEGDTSIETEDGTLTEVADIATEERLFSNGEVQTNSNKLKLQDYVGDLSSYVNLDVLQELKLMPAFIGDIIDCIKSNLSSQLSWSEGWNKKHGAATGVYNRNMSLPNLIILDVSGSIPRGISATMLTLIDTMRFQLNADLIITSSKSEFFEYGEPLPDPQTLRDEFGYANEGEQFYEIINNKIKPHYGHVISFGDDDTPDNYSYSGVPMRTKVHHVHHYHTQATVTVHETGYAKWCTNLCTAPDEVTYNTTWCAMIKEN